MDLLASIACNLDHLVNRLSFGGFLLDKVQ